MATNNKQGFLWVPLRLQAMCRDATQRPEDRVVRAMANYRKLPFVRGDEGYDDNANLGGHILTPPFVKDPPHPAGIHLHWLLPNALAHGEHDEEGTHFHHVPNRWLILRSGGGSPERQWVVESDYIYPEGYEDEIESEGEAPVNVLVVPDPAPDAGYRFRFVGRALPLDEWREQRADPENKYLSDLTAVGPEVTVKALEWVRASFASFYPNCRTVFGFHDKELETRTPPQGLRYDVIGWYADPARDRLAPLLAVAKDPEELRGLLEEELKWSFEPGSAMPAASLYHGRLTFNTGARSGRDVVRELPKPSLTIAQTETEALAAYLAYVYAPETNDGAFEQRRKVEDQLEALQLTDRLAGHTLDLDALLTEARHERGFASLSAGIRWSIKPKTDTSTDFFELFRRSPRRARAARTQPPAWAGLLEALNAVEEEYQRALATLEHKRQRMYARWYDLMSGPDRVVGNQTGTSRYLRPKTPWSQGAAARRSASGRPRTRTRCSPRSGPTTSSSARRAWPSASGTSTRRSCSASPPCSSRSATRPAPGKRSFLHFSIPSRFAMRWATASSTSRSRSTASTRCASAPCRSRSYGSWTRSGRSSR